MVEMIDKAHHQSLDPPEGAAIITSWKLAKGHRGRRRVELDREILCALVGHMPITKMAYLFNCSARTIHRRMIDYGLVIRTPETNIQPGEAEDILPAPETNLQPGEAEDILPTPETNLQPGGAEDILPEQMATLAPVVSRITDQELDGLLVSILQSFPTYGRRMIAGHLTTFDHYRVHGERIRASYRRVHGTPGVFGGRRIHRRRYKVPGANSLWHHDGQHGK